MSTNRPRRLLVVVAHPDDETFGCGSILAWAADAGWTTAVLCATRGEAGERVGGPPGDLADVREAETRAAAELLGVGGVTFGSFGDSGMNGDAGPETLVGAPLDDVTDLVRERVERLAPHVVVTIDGGDGHRDHARIRDATLAAVEAADHEVERVYLQCLPVSLMRRWVEHLVTTDPSWEHLRGDIPGTPDELVTTVLGTAAQLDRREAAIALHASQRSPFEGLPPDLRHDFLTQDHLRRVRPAWLGGPVEVTL